MIITAIIYSIIIAVICQISLYVISKKINYSYDKKQFYLLILLGSIINYGIFNAYKINIQSLIISLICMINLSSINIDLNYKEIPDSYNLATFIFGILLIVFTRKQYEIFLLVGFLSFIVYLLIAILSGGALGGGDIKMAGALGFSLPYHLIYEGIKYSVIFTSINEVLYFIFYSSLAGTILSIFIMLFKKGKLKTAIPYGPYILLGYLMLILPNKFITLKALAILSLFMYSNYFAIPKK